MSFWSRISNVFRADRLNREIDEELASHLAEAVEQGRDPAAAGRAFGSPLHIREESRDVRLFSWLDSLRADSVFGWRQLWKRKATSAAAVLSLALAIGSCTAAFRLIDAILLRPLPVADARHLYALARVGISPENKPQDSDGWAYPAFHLMRAAAAGQAELIAVSYAERTDLTYDPQDDVEKPYVQYVSGWMFDTLGLHPSLGRLFTANDDQRPGAHPYAVLSYDYWSRRFSSDPAVIGRSFRLNNTIYQIVGVTGESFTGTEPGTVTDIFLPTMMNPSVERLDATWHRTLALVRPGTPLEPLREKLDATSRAFEENRAKSFKGMSKERIRRYLDQKLVFEPAAAGVSGMQKNYRVSLLALAVLVALVLLIACANVANLMTAQAAARAREIALRISIGAGRLRLVQLVLVESLLLALISAAVGLAFAWWSAPFVVSRINPPDNPARLQLPADWRVLAFGLVLTFVVTLLFGLLPALRASAVRPASALKGGDDPRARHRIMHGVIGAQAAFCFLVVFVSGLLVATFQRLASQSPGFSSDRLLVLDTVSETPQDPALWEQVANHLRSIPGVEAAVLCDWALMNGNSRNNLISIDGSPVTENLTYFRYITPGWAALMKIPLLDGRDLRPDDTSPGAAIVNEAFARAYLEGRNPVGKWFDRSPGRTPTRYRIVGLIRDEAYRSLREPVLPIAFVPFRAIDTAGASIPVKAGTFTVRTASANPLALAQTLRREVARARPGFRVSNLHTQLELNQRQTVRERLLATLALFFAAVALLLAGIGLYGVLDYSVVQRRREIGIRMAIGAPASDIARRVAASVFRVVLAGAVAGVALGIVSARSIESLFYQVKAGDWTMLALPALAILAAATAAAVPAVIHAIRTDPVSALRPD